MVVVEGVEDYLGAEGSGGVDGAAGVEDAWVEARVSGR